jgi:2-polyprenyl-6-methoxyphenol hydroxylase-like FAD-dependent oxidoreductase
MSADVKDPRWGTAVVCGAGMAGLLSARVLADFFDRVVIVERDHVASEPSPRRGVPQSHQVHVLLPGGFRVLCELFPGLEHEAVARGAAHACLTTSAKRFYVNDWLPRFESDLWTLHCSRSLLEWVTMQRVVAWPNVELIGDRRVIGLIAADGQQATGVATTARQPGDAVTVVAADLVVDALGRSSPTPAWLAQLGFKAPEETIVNAHWGYASRYFRMPRGWDPGYLLLAYLPTGRGGQTRGAVLQRHEGDRWLCTLVGCAKDHPPRDDDGFTAFAGSLPIPEIIDAIAAAEPLTTVEAWHRTENRMRHFDTAAARPSNVLFTGDSACALNPIYGQGMSVAALAAVALRSELTATAWADDGMSSLAHRFQRRLQQTVLFPWAMACGADHAVPGVEGAPPAPDQVDLDHRWQRAMLLATHDPQIARVRLETQMLVRSPDWLYHGPIAERIERDWAQLGAAIDAAT